MCVKVNNKEVSNLAALSEALKDRDFTQVVKIELVRDAHVVAVEIQLKKDEKLGLDFASQ